MNTFDPTTIVALLTMLIGAVCVGDIGVGALLIVLGFLFTIKKPNNFGGMLKTFRSCCFNWWFILWNGVLSN